MIGAAGACLRVTLGGVVLTCAALYALNLYDGGLACAATPAARFLDSLATAQSSLARAFDNVR